MDTPIVVAAYNRPDSLSRLLGSLSKANYGDYNVTLIISIDYDEANSKVVEVAKSFNWSFGEKKLIIHKKNLGLRKHILSCGDLSLEYGSVLVLEDDLYVSPNFYSYGIAAQKFVSDNPMIGGISLYNHQIVPQTLYRFEALEDGYDNYYLQYGASWGQIWSEKHWKEFKAWYTENPEVKSSNEIPANVSAWSEQSWLKFYTTYLIRTNKFFFYPKTSLSTNFGEAGTHNNFSSSSFQVPLSINFTRTYSFVSIAESLNVYDAFFENLRLHRSLDSDSQQVNINLHGYKPIDFGKKYILTRLDLNDKVIRSYGLKLRPIENNIFFNIPGNDIHLYELSEKSYNIKRKEPFRFLEYNFRIMTLRDCKVMFHGIFLQRLRNLKHKIFGKF